MHYAPHGRRSKARRGASKMKVVPLDVSTLSDYEIGIRLIAMGEDFPYGGDNYNIPMLEEALKRQLKLDASSSV